MYAVMGHTLTHWAALMVDEEESHGKRVAKKATNTVLNFFGDVGKSFYDEYEKLKRKRKDD